MIQQPSRREFIKTALGAATLGAAAPGDAEEAG